MLGQPFDTLNKARQRRVEEVAPTLYNAAREAPSNIGLLSGGMLSEFPSPVKWRQVRVWDLKNLLLLAVVLSWVIYSSACSLMR